MSGDSIDATVRAICDTKAELVRRAAGRTDLTPILEYRRDGRLVATLHAAPDLEEVPGQPLPLRSASIAAAGFMTDDVRIAWEGVMAVRDRESAERIRRGDLDRERREQADSDVRETVLIVHARPDEPPAVYFRPYEYAELDGGGIEVRWLEPPEEDGGHMEPVTPLSTMLCRLFDVGSALEELIAALGRDGQAQLARATARTLSDQGHAVVLA